MGRRAQFIVASHHKHPPARLCWLSGAKLHVYLRCLASNITPGVAHPCSNAIDMLACCGAAKGAALQGFVLLHKVCKANPHLRRNPLRRSASFAFKESLKLKFMSRGSQPNLVAYADSEAENESSSKDEMRKKAGGNLMRNVSLSCQHAAPSCYGIVWHRIKAPACRLMQMTPR